MKEDLQQVLIGFLCLSLAFPAALAQAPAGVQPAEPTVALPAVSADSPGAAEWQASGLSTQSELSYRLGSGDQITISVVELEDLQAQQMRIGSDGIVGLPLVGRVQAAGYTVKEFTLLLEQKLKQYVLEPHVAVNVVEFRSQPVSILGAVNAPGVHQLQGRKTIVEILSQAGGIRQDAGYQLRVTRRAEYGQIPIPGAEFDPSGEYSVADIDLDELTEGLNPAANIQIMPHDVISVPTGKMIYAIGALNRAGGYVLSERQEMSVLELLALAGGIQDHAAKHNARILRPKPGGAGREEIVVDIKDIMKNEGADIPLYSGDILFIPESGSKKVLTTVVAAGIGVGSGIALWRLGRGGR